MMDYYGILIPLNPYQNWIDDYAPTWTIQLVTVAQMISTTLTLLIPVLANVSINHHPRGLVAPVNAKFY
jgi:hypothetical protein